MRMRVPAMMKLVGERPLAAASALMLSPLAAAMPESVSPGWTRCPPPDDVPVDTEPPPEDDVPATVPRAGMLSGLPAMTRPVGERPLAAASDAGASPVAAAIPDSGSPGPPTWAPQDGDATPDEPEGAGATVPRAGIVRRLPATTRPFADKPFAAARAEVDSPLAAAMPDSVSPGTTRWPPEPAELVGDDDGTALADETGPAAGICSVRPAMTRESGLRPLAAASVAGDMPLSAAMPERVSPGLTVCTAAPAGAVPMRAATAPATAAMVGRMRQPWPLGASATG